MIDLEIDEPSDLILTVGTGRWSVAEVDAYFMKLKAAIAGFRERNRPIRFLRNVVRAEVQSAEIEARINEHSRGLYQPGDRIALVVKNEQLLAHVRGAIALQGTALFCSPKEAETWLFAGSPQDVTLTI